MTATLPARDFIRAIGEDTPEKRRCREAAAAGDDKAKRTAKGAIPFWAIAGAYVGEDAPQGTLAQIDLDKMTPEGAEQAKAIIAGIGCALIAALSVSGRGVFAIIDTGGKYDPAKLKASYLDPISKILKAKGIGHEPDSSTLKVGTGRVESYDPAPYVAPERVVADPETMRRRARIALREARRERERQEYAAFYAHPISKIAASFCKNAPVGSMATAAAIDMVGAFCDVRSRVCGRETQYAARAFCVCVQEAGAGKTTILDALEDTLAACRPADSYAVSKPKSEAAIDDVLWDAGTREVPCADTAGRCKTRREPLPADESAKNAFFIIDEAGDFLKSTLANDKCGNLDSGLRGAFNTCFTPAETKRSRNDGERRGRVPANATMLLCATPRQWIDYVSGEHGEDGMDRRRLVFMPDEDAPEPIHADGRALTLAELDDEIDRADVDRAALRDAAACLDVLPRRATFSMSREARESTRRATQALADAGLPSNTWDTLITNYAALCAAARVATNGFWFGGAQDCEITAADIEATADILRASVCVSREKIASRAELRAARRFKGEGEVWGEIHDWLEKAPRRTDKTGAWLQRRPPIYREIYAKMLKNGELVVEPTGTDRKRAVRLATDEEAAALAVRAPARNDGGSVWDGTAPSRGGNTAGKAGATAPKAYADCDEDDRAERVTAYIARYEQDHPIVEGARNDAINRLVYQLQGAGMWDDVAQGMVRKRAEAAGLDAREIGLLMRARKSQG